MADQPPYIDTGTPRWVKVSGIIGGVLVVLVAIMMFTGHGPGRHIPGADTPPSSFTEDTPGVHAPPKGVH